MPKREKTVAERATRELLIQNVVRPSFRYAIRPPRLIEEGTNEVTNNTGSARTAARRSTATTASTVTRRRPSAVEGRKAREGLSRIILARET